jgi:hypothetical protein
MAYEFYCDPNCEIRAAYQLRGMDVESFCVAERERFSDALMNFNLLEAPNTICGALNSEELHEMETRNA